MANYMGTIILSLVIIHFFLVLILLVIVILIGFSPFSSILLINLCDMRATGVVVNVSLNIVVYWLVMTLDSLFVILLVILIVAHVFFLLVLFYGLASNHVAVIHHHVVALILSLFVLFLTIV